MQRQIKEDSKLNLGPDLILAPITSCGIISRLINKCLSQQFSVDTTIRRCHQKPLHRRQQACLRSLWNFPQVSCYNNKTVKQPPKTLQELVKLGASGVRIGLSTRTDEIFWTAGSTGAIPEISSLMNKKNQNKPSQKSKNGSHGYDKRLSTKTFPFTASNLNLSMNWPPTILTGSAADPFEAVRLKETMGEQLSIATLPNGVQTKAFAWPLSLVLA